MATSNGSAAIDSDELDVDGVYDEQTKVGDGALALAELRRQTESGDDFVEANEDEQTVVGEEGRVEELRRASLNPAENPSSRVLSLAPEAMEALQRVVLDDEAPPVSGARRRSSARLPIDLPRTITVPPLSAPPPAPLAEATPNAPGLAVRLAWLFLGLGICGAAGAAFIWLLQTSR